MIPFLRKVHEWFCKKKPFKSLVLSHFLFHNKTEWPQTHLWIMVFTDTQTGDCHKAQRPRPINGGIFSSRSRFMIPSGKLPQGKQINWRWIVSLTSAREAILLFLTISSSSAVSQSVEASSVHGAAVCSFDSPAQLFLCS